MVEKKPDISTEELDSTEKEKPNAQDLSGIKFEQIHSMYLDIIGQSDREEIQRGLTDLFKILK